MHFIQTWEEDIPSSVVLSEAEESAIVVMAELMGISRGMVYSGMQYAALTHRYKEIREEAETEREKIAAEEQLGKLAQFIMDEVEGEPSADESAVECAIRIIRGRAEARAELKYWNAAVAEALESLVLLVSPENQKLAHFLVTNARGPLPKADNWSECAIQVIKDLLAEVDQLKAQVDNG